MGGGGGGIEGKWIVQLVVDKLRIEWMTKKHKCPTSTKPVFPKFDEKNLV